MDSHLDVEDQPLRMHRFLAASSRAQVIAINATLHLQSGVYDRHHRCIGDASTTPAGDEPTKRLPWSLSRSVRIPMRSNAGFLRS